MSALRNNGVWLLAGVEQEIFENGARLDHHDVYVLDDRRHAHLVVLLERHERAEDVALNEVESIRDAELLEQPRHSLGTPTFDVTNADHRSLPARRYASRFPIF